MGLSAGIRLGPYEMVRHIGAGGMGDVYQARDVRLGRDVAVKVLPPRFAGDPELIARFEREARAISSLNHPNICALYDVGFDNYTHYLVMEYLEGETLAARLSHGPLSREEALRLSLQILDALEAAHGKAILHRDLKPGNVHVTSDGHVKLLDFGLAKTIAEALSDGASGTGTDAQTRTGTVLGTPAYMSPEQTRGQPVDKRTDLWSFGCILFESLSGRRPFGGNTTSDVIAAVLQQEPDWGALPRGTPPAIRHLLERCLEKDVGRRLRDAGDAHLEIEEELTRARAGRSRRPRRVPVVAAIALLGLLAGLIWLVRRAAPAPPRIHAPQLAQATFAESVEEFPSWSPDARLAYSAEVQGIRKIFVQPASGGDAPVTRGDFDEIQPAWSPDGRTLLFVRAQEARRKLEPGDVFGSYSAGADVWAMDVGSGRERKLIQNAFNPSFSPDGRRIAVDASWVGSRRIWVTDGEGRNPVQLTSDSSEAVEHVRPRWSPDGKHVVFQNVERTKFDVRVAEVASQKLQWVTNDLFQEVSPVWSSDGRAIWFSSYRSGGLNLWRVAVSANGRPTGRLEQVTTGAGQDLDVTVSPDGRKLAFSILKQNANIWRMPVSPQTGEPAGVPEELIGTTREDSRGAWSPTGDRIAFNSDRGGEMNIWIYRISDGATRQLTRGRGGDFQPFWSPDGKRVVFFSSRSGNADIWAADVDSGTLTQLTRGTATDVNPSFSPDGNRIAYQSDEGGRMEIWVMSADGRDPRQLTHDGVAGGHFLRWTPAGDSIYFRCLCGGQPQTRKAPVKGGEAERLPEISGGAHISFSPDHTRLLDVVGHKTLWVSPLSGGSPQKVFEFDDPGVRIDYPVWSPDGHWVLFDRFRPQGGDIWVMSGLD